MTKKQYIVILCFVLMGILLSIITKKYISYMVSTTLLGISTALTLFNNKDKFK